MANLIIVDDEKLEIEGIKSTVDFYKLGITEIFEANNIRQAKELFLNNSIDLMFCDIEMPQGSGIELLEWVRENFPKTECIFITCHADFNYSIKAIQLGSLDYILKPAMPEELEKVVVKAMEKIKMANEQLQHSRFSKLWVKHQPLIIERFWLDIINQTIPSTHEEIRKAALEINFPGLEDMNVIPILVKVQNWNREMNMRDEKLMEFAIGNIAQNLILKEESNGITLELDKETVLILIYLDEFEDKDLSLLKEDCKKYITECSKYLGCDLSCYLGSRISNHELFETVNKLLELDKNNVIFTNKVFSLDEKREVSQDIRLPDMGMWLPMLESGKKDLVLEEIYVFMKELTNSKEVNANVLYQFQQDFIQVLHSYLKGKGVLAHMLYSDNQSAELYNKATRSIAHMIKFAEYGIEKALSYVAEIEKSKSLVGKVKSFIKLNIDKELTREYIADQVYLNPIYLARIFKKETGIPLSEYIQKERLKVAKELLSKSNMPVSSIAAQVGYTNFSHFSRMFRKALGISPVDYRKNTAKN
ncbi:response regulator [Clostridium sp. SYSU_GA19001]|uniref:response regulator transcription factor n=1 Tax=Clostridium caldaquaticum TaxID=2940653 RepID=UPI002077956D|nr:helix-turn-helix domain-containing protein [Clostridium caldaquaticum]MCM8709907.1 response regulator [Clostridium caldaquaticum]